MAAGCNVQMKLLRNSISNKEEVYLLVIIIEIYAKTICQTTIEKSGQSWMLARGLEHLHAHQSGTELHISFAAHQLGAKQTLTVKLLPLEPAICQLGTF